MEKFAGEIKDSNNNSNNNNETITVRLARYLNHVKRVKNERTKNLLKEAETQLVEQQELHNEDLEELREKYESQLLANREQFEKFSQSKVKSAEMASQRDKRALEHSLKTLSFNRRQVSEGDSRVAALEQTNVALNETIRNLQASWEIEHAQANKLEEEARRLQKELASKIEQLQPFLKEMDDSLSLEIAEFDYLLSREEKRIKLSDSSL